MFTNHEHYLGTDGKFDPGWLEAVDSSIPGVKEWRFPYFLIFNGVRHDRVLEIDTRVEPSATASPETVFVGKLATGWLVTVETKGEGYSLHLALEPPVTEARQQLATLTDITPMLQHYEERHEGAA